MFDLPNYHPLAVHFPIALLASAVLFELVYLVSGKEVFSKVSFWVLLLGALGAGVAVITGEMAEKTIAHNEDIHEMMKLHEKFGIAVLSIFGILLLWKIFRMKKMKKGENWIFFLVMLAGIYCMVQGGDLGHGMVFREGAGVKPMEKYMEGGHHHEHEEGEEHEHEHHHD